MFRIYAANRFLARLLAGVMIGAMVVAFALEGAVSRTQIYL
jgi:hypothetical protein